MMHLSTDAWGVSPEDFPRDGSPGEQAAFLVRYAILAPSSHNSQPWEFRIDNDQVELHADLSRWLRVADADQRELYLSVGCALENLIVAAEHFGFSPTVGYVPNQHNAALVARLRLEKARDEDSPSRPVHLFAAIPQRHTNRREYDNRPVPEAVLSKLEALAVEPGISVHFTNDVDVRRRVEALTLKADAHQFADPEWRQELGYWFGQGAFGTSWLISKVAQFAVSHLNLSTSTRKKDQGLLQSASTLGLVSVDEVTRESRVRAGQVFERLCLAATNAGLVLQPMNQILQVAEVRDEFEDLLPVEWSPPQITFRLGYAEAEDHTPRRPLEDVIRSHSNM
jgi:nitroreductase